MPQIEKHPIAAHMHERALSDEGELQALLTALQALIRGRHYGAAKHVEYAIVAFRRDELDAFVGALEQHEFARNKAATSSEGK